MDKLTPERRSWVMSRIKSKNTTPEIIVRRLVFSMGYRYRLHDARLAGKPDLVFPARHKVIFVNGCFWHGHEGCRRARMPTSHSEYWLDKIGRNRARDEANVAALLAHGWKVLTIWECETRDVVALEARLGEFLAGT